MFRSAPGPRVCLGASFAMQEGMLILAYLARHFRFEPVEGHTPRPIARLTLRSENGVRLQVFRRKGRRAGMSRTGDADADALGMPVPQ